MTIGKKIQALRRKAGYTQKGLAEKCGVATGTIQQYELDKRQPKIEQLYKIADVLNVQIGDLIGRPEEEAPSGVSPEHPVSFPGLERKAAEIGYYIGYGCDYAEYSDNDIWITYPDGKRLDISIEDLDMLNDETDSYLKFKLEELRKKKQEKK